MTRNEQILVQCVERSTRALEALAVSANQMATAFEEIRIELKKKRFDDAHFATFEKDT